jgi:Fur family ferric uptake transcriptional regulator
LNSEISFFDNIGFKITRAREVIIEALLKQNSHISADALLEVVRKIEPKIGLATVYRTLKMLQDQGLVKAHYFADSQALFELETSPDDHHDHLICEQCRHIEEFTHPQIEALQELIAQQHGFRLTKHRMELYGICQSCRVF